MTLAPHPPPTPSPIQSGLRGALTPLCSSLQTFTQWRWYFWIGRGEGGVGMRSQCGPRIPSIPRAERSAGAAPGPAPCNAADRREMAPLRAALRPSIVRRRRRRRRRAPSARSRRRRGAAPRCPPGPLGAGRAAVRRWKRRRSTGSGGVWGRGEEAGPAVFSGSLRVLRFAALIRAVRCSAAGRRFGSGLPRGVQRPKDRGDATPR